MHGGINLIDKRPFFSATVESVADRMATLKLVFFLAACRTIQEMSVLRLLKSQLSQRISSPFLRVRLSRDFQMGKVRRGFLLCKEDVRPPQRRRGRGRLSK